jgi:hypothetical protein
MYKFGGTLGPNVTTKFLQNLLQFKAKPQETDLKTFSKPLCAK